MKKEIVNGATVFTMAPDPENQENQEYKKDLERQREFFGRMAPIPVDKKERFVYSAVAAEEFKKIFPEIAAAIEALRDEKKDKKRRPVFIKGFRVGHVEHGLDYESVYDIFDKEPSPLPRRTQKSASDPEHVLALAAAWLLDPENLYKGYSNSSFGSADSRHPHDGYAVVAGRHGVDGVTTGIWYPDSNKIGPDFSAEVRRGSLLIIPPGFEHDVEGFKFKPEATNKGERNTTAIIMEKNTRYKRMPITPEDVEAGRKNYILSGGRGR